METKQLKNEILYVLRCKDGFGGVSMVEYISREAAIKDFERCNLVNSKWTPERVKQLLCRCPKVDAAPVLYGEWIDIEDTMEVADGIELPVNVCSACGEYVLLGKFKNFCPNCGAKMRRST